MEPLARNSLTFAPGVEPDIVPSDPTIYAPPLVVVSQDALSVLATLLVVAREEVSDLALEQAIRFIEELRKR